MICQNPECQKENPDSAIFCKYCGKRLVSHSTEETIKVSPEIKEKSLQKPWKCRICGTENASDTFFCQCGAKKNKEPEDDNPVIPDDPIDPSREEFPILKCIILFFLGLWLCAVLPTGAAATSSIPGVVSIGIIIGHKDSKIPLFLCWGAGLVVGLIFGFRG